MAAVELRRLSHRGDAQAVAFPGQIVCRGDIAGAAACQERQEHDSARSRPDGRHGQKQAPARSRLLRR